MRGSKITLPGRVQITSQPDAATNLCLTVWLRKAIMTYEHYVAVINRYSANASARIRLAHVLSKSHRIIICRARDQRWSHITVYQMEMGEQRPTGM